MTTRTERVAAAKRCIEKSRCRQLALASRDKRLARRHAANAK